MVRREISRETQSTLIKEILCTKGDKMRETDLFAYTWPLQALWDVSFGLQLQLQQSGIVALVHCHVCQPCVASLDIPDHLK